MELDLDAILKIMDRFDKSNMTGFSYEDGTVSLKLDSEKIPVVATAAAPAAVTIPANVENVAPAAEKKEDEGTVVKSPLVGTFYAAKGEGAEPFVSVGDTVKKGQAIGMIEAMKLMNEIESEADGTVAEIYVENEQLVEFGQPIIRIV